jgi:hypothetical protein
LLLVFNVDPAETDWDRIASIRNKGRSCKFTIVDRPSKNLR